jgi:hypothetical protein
MHQQIIRIDFEMFRGTVLQISSSFLCGVYFYFLPHSGT